MRSFVLSYPQADGGGTEPVQILRCHTRRAVLPSGSADQSGTAVYHLSPPATWNTGSSIYWLDCWISWSIWRRCSISPHCSSCCMIHKYTDYNVCVAGSADWSRTADHRLAPPSIWYTVSSFLDSLQLIWKFIFSPFSSSCRVAHSQQISRQNSWTAPFLEQLFTTSLLLDQPPPPPHLDLHTMSSVAEDWRNYRPCYMTLIVRGTGCWNMRQYLGIWWRWSTVKRTTGRALDCPLCGFFSSMLGSYTLV